MSVHSTRGRLRPGLATVFRWKKEQPGILIEAREVLSDGAPSSSCQISVSVRTRSKGLNLMVLNSTATEWGESTIEEVLEGILLRLYSDKTARSIARAELLIDLIV